MNKVTSIISKLPYGASGFTFQGGLNQEYYIEWFKRDENTGELVGLEFNEAADLKNFLDKNCGTTFKKNTIEGTNEEDIPHESSFTIPDNDIPKYYPFEDLKMFGVISNIPFNFEILGYNRFLENR